MSAASQTVQVIMTARDLMSRKLRDGETRMRVMARVARHVLPIALGVATGAMTRFTISAAAAAQQITKSAEAAGLSVDTFQALSGTLQAAGVDSRTLQIAMRTLQKQLSDAARGETGAGRLFAQLGIDIRDANGELIDGEEALRRVSDGLGVMENQTEKAGIAAKLLGRNYNELLPFLAQGREHLENLNAAALDSGQVIAGDLLEAGASAAEAWDNLGQVLGASSQRFWLTFAPALKSWSDWANDYAKGVNLRWIAEEDAGGMRELRGELHTLSAAFDDYTRRWEGEQSFIDPSAPLLGGAFAAKNISSAIKNYRRAMKEVERLEATNAVRRRDMLKQDLRFRGQIQSGIDSKTARAMLQRHKDIKAEMFKVDKEIARATKRAEIAQIRATIELRKGLGVATGATLGGVGIAYALREEIPELEKAISDINRIVEEAGTEDIIRIDLELEKTRKEMFKRGYEQMLLRDQATAEAERDLYAKREQYFVFAEFALGAKRTEIADRVAQARAARQAYLGQLELDGEQARAAKLAEVWDKFYTTLELERARADGNEEKTIHDQTNKREADLRAALKLYAEAGASPGQILERELEGQLAITKLHNRKMDTLAHTQRLERIEWERQAWDADTQLDKHRMEAKVSLFKQEQQAYKDHLQTLDDTQMHYWTVERERILKSHEMRKEMIHLEYKANEDRLGIADYALQSAIAINRKGERESRDQFERNKQLQTGLAIVNTASAATAVMKNVALAGGWAPLAIAEMGLVLAAGFEQVRRIQSTEYGGGSTGGGSVSAGGSGSIGAGTGTNTGFTQNTVISITGGSFTDRQVRELIEAIGDEADRNGGRIGRLEVRG